MSSASARSSAFLARIVSLSEGGTERYFSEYVLKEKRGKRESEDVRVGVKPSRGPREGVEAESWPEGEAVRKVPLLSASAGA